MMVCLVRAAEESQKMGKRRERMKRKRKRNQKKKRKPKKGSNRR